MNRYTKHQRWGEQWLLFLIVLIGVAILVTPYLARSIDGNTALLGEQSTLHARMAEKVMRGTAGEEDDRVSGEKRALRYTPYHYVLGLLGRMTGIDRISMILPATLGILSLFLAYLLLKQFSIDGKTRFLILLPLLLSPAFIFTYTVSNPHAFAIMLTLLGFLCFLQEGRYIRALAIVPFGLAALSQPFNAALIIALLFWYTLATNTRKGEVALITAVLLVLLAIQQPQEFMTKYERPTANIIRESISDLGGKIGFGIFYLILAIIGFFASWKSKQGHAGAYLIAATLLLAYPLLGMATFMYLNFFATYFVGLGLAHLQGRRWEFTIIRNLTFLIIICGLLFSSISYLNRLSDDPITKETADGLEWLADYSLGDAVVLSHFSHGYAIEYVAGRQVVLDSLFSSLPDAKQRLLDIETLFYTINLEEAEGILDRYGIDYIFIDSGMKERLVWDEPDQGLLYLLHNSETFKNVYATEEVEIWKVG